MEWPLILAVVLIILSLVGFLSQMRKNGRKHYQEWKRQSRSYFQ